MDRCALEFIARRWLRRAEVWIIALLLAAGGAALGRQSAYWSMSSTQANQLKQIRDAHDAAVVERDHRLDELTRLTDSAADKASKLAADKVDNGGNRAT
ncbi:hypothetical protein [Pseudomonas sp. B8(2017)]|uniref:hypothetical protein n=1 Tax=Pseudomonas sp. B8(2017) TaxID=1981711 RepID=UPI000A1F2F39|nr:hypothetical protein [Pseudomonas sp. B8(2017)]